MFNNSQQESFLNSPDRKKALGMKSKSSVMDHVAEPKHGGHDENEDHAAMHAEHGPVVEAHMKSDHEMQEHHVHLTHQDGHKRHSQHDSHGEATDHIKAAHDAGNEESDAAPMEQDRDEYPVE